MNATNPENPPKPAVTPEAGAGVTLEDMAKQLKALTDENVSNKAEMQTLKDTNERMDQLLQSRVTPPTPTPTPAGPDFSQWDIPAEAVNALSAHIGGQVANQISIYEQNRQIQEKFYSDYSDLKPHSLVVQAMSKQVEQAQPNLSTEQALKEVARRTRDYLKGIQKDTPTPPVIDPPEVLPSDQGGTGGGSPVPTPEPEFDPAKELQEEIASRNKARTAKTVG